MDIRCNYTFPASSGHWRDPVCEKSATRFFKGVRLLEGLPCIARCEQHATEVGDIVHEEISEEEYIVAEIMIR